MDCAEMFPCRIIHGAERSLSQKLPVPESLVLKHPWRQNIHVPEHLQGRNVHLSKCPGGAEMSLTEMLRAEMVGSLSLYPSLGNLTTHIAINE